MVGTGVTYGRFQILHHDHLKYIMPGNACCQHLVVGITNPDPSLTREDSADPNRSLFAENPLTYFECYTMIQSALTEAGLTCSDFSLVPFPINLLELYKYYVPMQTTFFLTIYDQWGNRKLERFEALGLKIEVLWSRPSHEKGLRGTEVRRRMGSGEAWEHLVSASVRELMNSWKIPERIRNLTTTSAPAP
jgi:nicotinamide mononucleotide adenylyltransferase